MNKLAAQPQRHLPKPPAWELEEDDRDPDADSWMVIYLDVMTLMLSVFVVLLAYSTFSPETYPELSQALTQPAEIEKTVEQTGQFEELAEGVVEEPSEVENERQETAPQDELSKKIQQLINERQLEESVEVTMTANQINLQIGERILFELGRADLRPSGELVLQQLAPLLRETGELVSVEGHTDPVPISNAQFASNWELSTERATRVLRYLIVQGVASNRLRAIGYAYTKPRADNATVEGRARNRRVSLVVHMQ